MVMMMMGACACPRDEINTCATWRNRLDDATINLYSTLLGARLENQIAEDDLSFDPEGLTLLARLTVEVLFLFTNAQSLETREIWARNLSVRSNLRR